MQIKVHESPHWACRIACTRACIHPLFSEPNKTHTLKMFVTMTLSTTNDLLGMHTNKLCAIVVDIGMWFHFKFKFTLILMHFDHHFFFPARPTKHKQVLIRTKTGNMLSFCFFFSCLAPPCPCWGWCTNMSLQSFRTLLSCNKIVTGFAGLRWFTATSLLDVWVTQRLLCCLCNFSCFQILASFSHHALWDSNLQVVSMCVVPSPRRDNMQWVIVNEVCSFSLLTLFHSTT